MDWDERKKKGRLVNETGLLSHRYTKPFFRRYTDISGLDEKTRGELDRIGRIIAQKCLQTMRNGGLRQYHMKKWIGPLMAWMSVDVYDNGLGAPLVTVEVKSRRGKREEELLVPPLYLVLGEYVLEANPNMNVEHGAFIGSKNGWRMWEKAPRILDGIYLNSICTVARDRETNPTMVTSLRVDEEGSVQICGYGAQIIVDITDITGKIDLETTLPWYYTPVYSDGELTLVYANTGKQVTWKSPFTGDGTLLENSQSSDLFRLDSYCSGTDKYGELLPISGLTAEDEYRYISLPQQSILSFETEAPGDSTTTTTSASYTQSEFPVVATLTPSCEYDCPLSGPVTGTWTIGMVDYVYSEPYAWDNLSTLGDNNDPSLSGAIVRKSQSGLFYTYALNYADYSTVSTYSYTDKPYRDIVSTSTECGECNEFVFPNISIDVYFTVTGRDYDQERTTVRSGSEYSRGYIDLVADGELDFALQGWFNANEKYQAERNAEGSTTTGSETLNADNLSPSDTVELWAQAVDPTPWTVSDGPVTSIGTGDDYVTDKTLWEAQVLLRYNYVEHKSIGAPFVSPTATFSDFPTTVTRTSVSEIEDNSVYIEKTRVPTTLVNLPHASTRIEGGLLSPATPDGACVFCLAAYNVLTAEYDGFEIWGYYNEEVTDLTEVFAEVDGLVDDVRAVYGLTYDDNDVLLRQPLTGIRGLADHAYAIRIENF